MDAEGLAIISTLEEQVALLKEQVRLLEETKNTVYEERTRLVQALTKLFPSFVMMHPEDPNWEPDWMHIICIEGPAGQMTWHVHDSQMGLFKHLAHGPNTWDGHTTEEKYERLARIPMIDLDWS